MPGGSGQAARACRGPNARAGTGGPLGWDARRLTPPGHPPSSPREAAASPRPRGRVARRSAGTGTCTAAALRGHLGHRAPRRPGAAAPDRSAWKRSAWTRSPMLPAAWPLVVAAGHARSVRGREEDPRVEQSGSGHRRRRGPRGRAHLPLPVRGRGLRQARAAAVDLVAHARRHPRRLPPPAQGPPTWTLADAARGQAAPTAGGDEPVARLQLAFDPRLSVGRVQTPTLADGGRAREGDPQLRPRGLPGGRGHVQPARQGDPPPHSRRGRRVEVRGMVPEGGRSAPPPRRQGGGAHRRPRAKAPGAREHRLGGARHAGCRPPSSTTSPSCSATRTASTG